MVGLDLVRHVSSSVMHPCELEGWWRKPTWTASVVVGLLCKLTSLRNVNSGEGEDSDLRPQPMATILLYLCAVVKV